MSNHRSQQLRKQNKFKKLVSNSFKIQRRLLLLFVVIITTVLLLLLIKNSFGCGKYSKYGFIETKACHSNTQAKRAVSVFDSFLKKPSRTTTTWGGNKCFVRKFEKTSGFCACDLMQVAGLRKCQSDLEVDCDKMCKKVVEEFIISSGSSSTAVAQQQQSSCEKSSANDNNKCALKRVFEERPEGYVDAMKQTKKLHGMFKSVLVKTIPNGFSFQLPSDRRRPTIRRDFVLAGERLTKKRVDEIREKTEAFVKNIPNDILTISNDDKRNDYFFANDRGIVIVGGSKYSIKTTYWICVHAIRRAKSKLPIELWFPQNELPSCDDIEDLRDLGVIVRSFSELGDALNFASKGKRKPSRFAYKLLALTFSSFKEVLSIDADNIALRDPESKLFESSEYKSTGALLWRDFWKDSSAPDARLALFGSEQTSSWPEFTHESGQILVDKRKHMNALFLALYFNAFDHIFYPLFGGFMGIGDKEVFAVALRYLKSEYTVVPHDPDHVGVRDDSSSNIFGNTMLHRDLHGDPLFLHANKGKMTNHVPDYDSSIDIFSKRHGIRRWEESLFLGAKVVRVINEAAGEHDFEKWIYELVSKNKCQFGDKSEAYFDILSEQSGRGPLLDGMFLTDYLENPGVHFLHHHDHHS